MDQDAWRQRFRSSLTCWGRRRPSSSQAVAFMRRLDCAISGLQLFRNAVVFVLLQTDVVKQVEAVLKSRDAYGGVFYEIGQHSPIAGIRKAQQVFQQAGADIIVSVGGGSPIDASKAILYNLAKDTGGPILKQIAIPTTLSAAEYTVSVLQKLDMRRF